MRIKAAVSLLIVFSLLFAFCSCKKLDSKGFEVVEEYYVTDDEGVTFEVQSEVNEEGETEYFYTDNNGNFVEVESKAVKVEKKKIKVTTTVQNTGSGYTEESISYTPEQQSFIDSITDPSKIEEMVEDVTVEFEAGDEPAIPEEQIENIIEETPTETEKVNVVSPVQKYYETLSQKNAYTLEVNIKVCNEGETSSMPIKVAKDGENRYLEASLPVSEEGLLKFKMITKDGKARLYIPSMRAYMDVPADSIGDFYENFNVVTEQQEDGTHVGAGKVTIGGEEYDVDICKSDDSTITYYFQNGALKRIEIKQDENNYSILEISSATDTVDKKLFVSPTGYFNMTDIIGADTFTQ